MERNERNKDTSSESDASDWAVIDEDLSLEWNDEAKYHFRSTNKDTVVDQRVEEQQLTREIPSIEGFGHSGDVSDEDSIEIVSDDANEDHTFTDDHWVTKNNEVESHVALTKESFESANLDSEDRTDMVWYPLRKNGLKIDDNVSSTYEPTVAQMSVETDRLQLFTYFAFIVAIFAVGVSLGYYFSGLQTCRTNTGYDGHSTSLSVNNRNLAQKLYRENKLLRHRLRNIYPQLALSLLDVTSCNRSTGGYNSHHQNLQDSQHFDLNGFTFNQHITNSSVSGDAEYRKKKEDQSASLNMNDPVNILLVENVMRNNEEVDYKILSKSEPLITLDIVTSDNIKKLQVNSLANDPESNIRVTLRNTVEKFGSVLISGERCHLATERAMSSSLELMTKIDQSLKVLDSVTVENHSTKFESRVAKFTLNVDKMSKKLVSKIDKTVYKLTLDILRQLEDTKRGICDMYTNMQKQNVSPFELPTGTLFAECSIGKKKKKTNDNARYHAENSETFIQSKKKGKKIYKKTEINELPKVIEMENKKNAERKKKEIVKRVNRAKNDEYNAKNKRLNSDQSNIDDVEKGRRNYRIKEQLFSEESGSENSINLEHEHMESPKQATRTIQDETINMCDNLTIENKMKYGTEDQKIPDHSGRTEKLVDSDKWLNTGDKVSNISGEWVIKMNRGREKQRFYEHQSDWVFDRASSRKIYRGNDNIKKTERRNAHHSESIRPTEKSEESKVQTGKYWREKKQMLNNFIPKTIVQAAEKVENAFKNFRGQNKQRARQQ